MFISRILVLCLFFQVNVLPSWAAPAVSLKRLPLLEDRLTIQVPHNAKSEARGHNIMAAPEPDSTETRIVIEEKNNKIVVMANELFAKPGADFPANASTDFKQSVKDFAAYKHISSQRPGCLITMFKRQSPPASPGEANLIGCAYISPPDNLVKYVAVYANPAAVQRWGTTFSFMENILDSIEVGSGTMNLRKRSDLESLKFSFGIIEIPDGMSGYVQKGPDFDVMYISKIKVLGEPSATLGMYGGYHPSFGPPAKEAPAYVSKGDGAKWYRRKGGKSLDCLIEHRLKDDTPYFLHFFVTADNEDERKEMIALAETWENNGSVWPGSEADRRIRDRLEKDGQMNQPKTDTPPLRGKGVHEMHINSIRK